jgi:hypothetical protein
MYDLLVIASVLGCGALGSSKGFRAAGIALLELICCFVPAVLLHESLADLLVFGVKFVAEPFLPQGYDLQGLAVFLCFSLVMWGGFGVLRGVFHATDDEDEDDRVAMNPLLDGIAGAVVGGIGGAVLAGTVFVTISMLPLGYWLKPIGDRMFFDVGTMMLRSAGRFHPDDHEGRSLVLYGEPPSRQSVQRAKLTTEPWFDVDEDSAATENDRYRDVDGGGAFTKDLYFEDLDNDGARRIGLIDKYVTGSWDSSLRSDTRERPDLKKPVAAVPPPPPKPEVAAKEPAEEAEEAEGEKQPRVAGWSKGGRLLPKRPTARQPVLKTREEMQDDF